MDARTPDARTTIFVVDDDAAVCRALGFALDLEGYAVETLGSGEALLLRQLPVENAFLVLDERLPGISGLNTLSQLRARGVRLPAVLVTSHPKPSLRHAAAAASVPILEKPLLSDTLIEAVRSGLGAHASLAKP